MKIITTSEFKSKTIQIFELAERERVVVKSGDKYVSLVVSSEPYPAILSKQWVEGFMSIPPEFRCNPFDSSPSGDLFYADTRNHAHIDKAMKGCTKKLSKEAQKQLLQM